MTISAILSGRGDHKTVTVSPQMSVRDVVALLASKRIGAVPVCDGGVVVGIFSERDFVYASAKQGDAALDQPVADLMTSPAMTVMSATPVMSALSLMTKRRIRHLPVVDDGALVGFVSIGDLVKYRIEKIEAEANAMRDYISMA